MSLFKDIFVLAIRLAGLWFLCLGLYDVIPLLSVGNLRLIAQDDLWAIALPIVFKLMLSLWLLRNRLIVRLAYPAEKRQVLTGQPTRGEVSRPFESSDQKLAHLVRASLLAMLFCGNATATPFTWNLVSDIHAAAIEIPRAPFPSSQSNDWASYAAFVPLHTNDGQVNVVGEIYPGDLYEQQILPNLVANTDTNTVFPPTVFSYISNQVQRGMLEVACDGNHDDDSVDPSASGDTGWYGDCTNGAQWNIWMGTNVFAPSPFFVRTMNPGDSKNMTFLYTNQGLKFVVCTMDWQTNVAPFISLTNGNYVYDMWGEYSNQLMWVSNQFVLYPNHLGVVVCHYALNMFGQLSTCDICNGMIYNDIGPSTVLPYLNGCPNLFLVISGHTRQALSVHQTFWVPGNPGHFALFLQWDTQQITNNIGGGYCAIFDQLTFEPELKRLFVRAYDSETGAYLTNGQYAHIQNVSFRNYQPFIASYSIAIPSVGGGFTKSVFPLK